LILTKLVGEVGPFLGTALVLGYSASKSQGATPGKSLLKLKIQNEDGSDAAATRSLSAGRSSRSQCLPLWQRVHPDLLNAIGWSGRLGGYPGLDRLRHQLCLTFRPDRQALHDTLTNTAVFKTQAAAAAAMPTPEQQPQKQAA